MPKTFHSIPRRFEGGFEGGRRIQEVAPLFDDHAQNPRFPTDEDRLWDKSPPAAAAGIRAPQRSEQRWKLYRDLM